MKNVKNGMLHLSSFHPQKFMVILPLKTSQRRKILKVMYHAKDQDLAMMKAKGLGKHYVMYTIKNTDNFDKFQYK